MFNFLNYISLSKTCQDTVISSISARKFAELVYASQFHYHDDQMSVKKLIADAFPVTHSNIAQLDIDDSVADSLKIGSIYLQKGLTIAKHAIPLIHSRKTIEQLELLAAATQSKRSILLEGGSCSRKTCLVQELARLTKNKLLVMSLNQDTEISHLIGQWVPTTTTEHDHNLYAKVDSLLENILKYWLLVACTHIGAQELVHTSVHFKRAYDQKQEFFEEKSRIVKIFEIYLFGDAFRPFIFNNTKLNMKSSTSKRFLRNWGMIKFHIRISNSKYKKGSY